MLLIRQYYNYKGRNERIYNNINITTKKGEFYDSI